MNEWDEKISGYRCTCELCGNWDDRNENNCDALNYVDKDSTNCFAKMSRAQRKSVEVTILNQNPTGQEYRVLKDKLRYWDEHPIEEETMFNLKMFDTVEDLKKLTGLSENELYDNGFDTDDWDVGFQSDRALTMTDRGNDGFGSTGR